MLTFNDAIKKIDMHLSDNKTIHIIIEGIDGVGKTTICGELMHILHQHIPYRTFGIRNPTHCLRDFLKHNPETSPYSIGTFTIYDAYYQEINIRQSDVLKGRFIVQDRSALLSGRCYNLPYMSETEKKFYTIMADNVKSFLLDDKYIFILDSDRPFKNAEDQFETTAMLSVAQEEYEKIPSKFERCWMVENGNIVKTVESILIIVAENL